MKNYLLCILIFYLGEVHAQMMNDYPFQSHVEHPAYKHGKGPKVLVDKAQIGRASCRERVSSPV